MSEADEPTTVIVCAGPPECHLQGDEAVKNQNEGCPRCRRIVIYEDGTEHEYKTLSH